MTKENEEQVQKQVFYTGFGESHNFQIAQGFVDLNKGAEEFKIVHQADFFKTKAIADLLFKVGSTDKKIVFFQSFDLTLVGENDQTLQRNFRVELPKKIPLTESENPDSVKWINSTFTLKEAFNAMQGRYVLKDFLFEDPKDESKNRVYKAYTTVDFGSLDKHGNPKLKKISVQGIDVDKLLAVLPIKDIDVNDNRKNTVDSINKGNLQAVTLVVGEQEKVYYIALDAPRKALAIYDDKFMRLGFPFAQTEQKDQGKDQFINKSTTDIDQVNDTKKKEVINIDKPDRKRGTAKKQKGIRT